MAIAVGANEESLFKFFIKVFSLDIDVSEHEENVFIEIIFDGICVERTVEHSTNEKTWYCAISFNNNNFLVRACFLDQ